MTTSLAAAESLIEIANIGAASAAGALSELIGVTVVVDVPEVAILRPEEAAAWLPDTRFGTSLVEQELVGELSGYVLTVLSNADGLDPATILWSGAYPLEAELREAALQQIASTMTAASLTTLGRFLQIGILARPPLAVRPISPDDGVTRVVRSFNSGSAIVFRTALRRDDPALESVVGCIVLILDDKSTLRLLNAARALLGLNGEGEDL
jgi:chemotaxis protein CheY-P-specific phosphatase CheC